MDANPGNGPITEIALRFQVFEAVPKPARTPLLDFVVFDRYGEARRGVAAAGSWRMLAGRRAVAPAGESAGGTSELCVVCVLDVLGGIALGGVAAISYDFVAEDDRGPGAKPYLIGAAALAVMAAGVYGITAVETCRERSRVMQRAALVR